MCLPRRGVNFSASRTSRPVCTRPTRLRLFTGLAWVWPAIEELDARMRTDRMADNTKRAGYRWGRNRERCFISPNDILEREFRGFIVSGQCACYIQSRHGARQGFLQYEQASRPDVAVAAGPSIPYDTESSQPSAQWKVAENHRFEVCGEAERFAADISEVQIFNGRHRQVGGIDVARDERRGKSWTTPVYYVSRQFHVHGRRNLCPVGARRRGFACRRLHQCDPGLAAWISEEPGVSVGSAEQSVAGEVQTAAADWGGFRTRHGDAAGRGNFVSDRDGAGGGWKSKRCIYDGKNHRAGGAGGGNPVDLCAGRGCEQQSGKSHHQHAVVWRKSGEGFGICHRVYPRRAGERGIGYSETLHGARRYHGGLTH